MKIGFFIRRTAIVISLGFILVGLFLNHGTITLLDRPWFISDKQETIEVRYISWMCNCADFIETKNYKIDPVAEGGENDFIFIEPAAPYVDLKSDSNFYNRNRYLPIKLTGRFYYDKGIPNEYKSGHLEDKPSHASVFHYDKWEYSKDVN